MTRKSRRLVLIFSALALLTFAAGLVLFALRDSIVFFYTPADIDAKNVAPGTRLRLGGLVKEGSVVRSEGKAITFAVRDAKSEVRVSYTGLLPDLCEKGLQIIVSISTWTNNLCDGTCVLDPHVHRFIRHKSYVMYRSARIEKAETLIKGVEQDLFVPHVAFEVHIFERIASGICSSLHTKRQVKRYYGCS